VVASVNKIKDEIKLFPERKFQPISKKKPLVNIKHDELDDMPDEWKYKMEEAEYQAKEVSKNPYQTEVQTEVETEQPTEIVSRGGAIKPWVQPQKAGISEDTRYFMELAETKQQRINEIEQAEKAKAQKEDLERILSSDTNWQRAEPEPSEPKEKKEKVSILSPEEQGEIDAELESLYKD
jgi:hypothetical protein